MENVFGAVVLAVVGDGNRKDVGRAHRYAKGDISLADVHVHVMVDGKMVS